MQKPGFLTRESRPSASRFESYFKSQYCANYEEDDESESLDDVEQDWDD